MLYFVCCCGAFAGWSNRAFFRKGKLRNVSRNTRKILYQKLSVLFAQVCRASMSGSTSETLRSVEIMFLFYFCNSVIPFGEEAAIVEQLL
jgi:hypothetical protein